RIRRTGGTRPRAGLRDVARPGRWMSEERRVGHEGLAGIAADVALIERARIGVVATGPPARLLRIRRTRGARARAGLRHVAPAGQAAPLPVQSSAASHAPAEARHSVVGCWKTSAGQSLVTPSQRSAASQGPAAERHYALLFASGGQVTLVPVHASATSHAPAA